MSGEFVSLEVAGLVGRPHTYDYAGLAALPGQVPDVSQLAAGRDGSAVKLNAIVAEAAPADEVRYITLFAEGDYSASVPLSAVLDQALVIYSLDGAPLPSDQGGPLRFLIPDVRRARQRTSILAPTSSTCGGSELSAEPAATSARGASRSTWSCTENSGRALGSVPARQAGRGRAKRRSEPWLGFWTRTRTSRSRWRCGTASTPSGGPGGRLSSRSRTIRSTKRATTCG